MKKSARMRKCLTQRAVGRIVFDRKTGRCGITVQACGDRADCLAGKIHRMNMRLDDEELNCQREQRQQQQRWPGTAGTTLRIAAAPQMKTSEMAVFDHALGRSNPPPAAVKHKCQVAEA